MHTIYAVRTYDDFGNGLTRYYADRERSQFLFSTTTPCQCGGPNPTLGANARRIIANGITYNTVYFLKVQRRPTWQEVCAAARKRDATYSDWLYNGGF